LLIDQLERSRRHAYLAPERIIQQHDQGDHGAGEERYDSSEQQMRSETEVEQPDQHHVEKRADRDSVPHDGRNAGGDAVNAQPAVLEEFIELAERRVVKRFLPFGLRLKLGKPSVDGGGPIDFPRIDAHAL
jgi:hypothetical protein